jgi:hypothetical protein
MATKHRFFTFLDASIAPDTPVALRAEVAAKAEAIDAHRKAALKRDERVTMTGMYNVICKLRAKERLTPKEVAIHESSACGVLRDLHDELDALVAKAYGWTWPEDPAVILERLVALHDDRVAEEGKGMVRWLRPDYQHPRFGAGEEAAEALPLTPGAPAPVAMALADSRPWPRDAVGQIGALRQLVAAEPVSAEEAAQRFTKAKLEIVARHLETLAILGELQRSEDGRYHEVLQPA